MKWVKSSENLPVTKSEKRILFRNIKTKIPFIIKITPFGILLDNYDIGESEWLDESPVQGVEEVSKEFVWTDELVLEILNVHRTSDQIITKFFWKKESIEAFKRFKQSQSNAGEREEIKRPFVLLLPSTQELADGLPYFSSDKENDACVKGAEWAVDFVAKKLKNIQ